jgi:hypothetical protein
MNLAMTHFPPQGDVPDFESGIVAGPRFGDWHYADRSLAEVFRASRKPPQAHSHIRLDFAFAMTIVHIRKVGGAPGPAISCANF